jgi:serine phosphatase RsbU (regulator of sigma subunit)
MDAPPASPPSPEEPGHPHGTDPGAPPPAPPVPPTPQGWRFLRAFLRALTDEGTFHLRENPSLWLGFFLAIPIPLLLFAVKAPLWIKVLAVFAPLAWAVILGAAGRVGTLAQEEQERLTREMRRARAVAEHAQETLAVAEEALDAEVARRKELELRQRAVLNELKLAQAVQSTLVPANVIRPEVEVAVRQIPSAYVGGDYLHANVVDGRWLYLCVADVSGHGISAALVVARIHGMVRRLTLEKQHPEAMLDAIHRAALQILQHTYFFLTVGMFRLDLADGTLDYATAGHPGQVLLRADGTMEILRTPNRLLGMDADVFDSERPSDSTKLKPGDMLVLFTDGLFEILQGGQGTVLGESGLRQRIAGLSGLAPTLMAGEILQELADFQGHSKFEDDVSLMVARFARTIGSGSGVHDARAVTGVAMPAPSAAVPEPAAVASPASVAPAPPS